MYSSFEDLEVYKATVKFTAQVYDLLKKSPLKEDFAMVDQVRRATISISPNSWLIISSTLKSEANFDFLAT